MNPYAPHASSATRWLRLLLVTLFVGALSVQLAYAEDNERKTLTGNWLASIARPAPLPPLRSSLVPGT